MNQYHADIARGGTYKATAYNPAENASAGQGVYLADNRQSAVAQRKQVEALANGNPAQLKANNTGLPGQLKSGIENLSGHSMDDVKVHYNSAKPAQLNAHAYAQGTDIHIASGQEKHLPHEAWHVVQQKQGRVKPTMQLKGKINVNDDRGLEKEADMMGAMSLNLLSSGTSITGHLKPNSSAVQGKFFKGYTPMNNADLNGAWRALLQQPDRRAALHPFQAEFEAKAASNRDEGTFFRWVVGKLDGENKSAAVRLLKRWGVEDGDLRGAMRTIGNVPRRAIPRHGLIVETERLKDEELDPNRAAEEAPPSPRDESRIIQIPRLVAAMQSAFNKDYLLKHFHYIIAGGAAMALKRPKAGRLGRASTNMRDIDMDFQVSQSEQSQNDLRAKIGRATRKIRDLDTLMKYIKTRMAKCLFGIPGLGGALSTEDVKVSGRNTVMFNKGDMEYSFHFVNDEPLLKFFAVQSDDTHVKIIHDDSHWALTKSALRARLKRPDKIQKTLIDACVQIGAAGDAKHNVRMQETVAIVFSGLRSIGTARNTLRRLAGPAGVGAGGVPFPRQIIAGLSADKANRWQQHLDNKTPLLYDREVKERLNDQEMKDVRYDYYHIYKDIIVSIINKANGEHRQDIINNARTLLREFNNRFHHAKRKALLAKPNIKAIGRFSDDHDVIKRPDNVEHAHTIKFGDDGKLI